MACAAQNMAEGCRWEREGKNGEIGRMPGCGYLVVFGV